MEKWEKTLSDALKRKAEAEALVSKATKELMKSKGFSKEQVDLFDASFASGNETIVVFNDDGEFCDLGLENFCEMTKEEIIARLKPHLQADNVKLLCS